MGLLQNGYRHNLTRKVIGVTNLDGWNPSVGVYQGHRAGANRNMFAGEAIEDDLASVPNGNRPSQAWIMARKNGGMSSRNASFTISSSGFGWMGAPIEGSTSFTISFDVADGQLISSGVGSASLSITVNSPLLTASVSGTGTSNITITCSPALLGAEASGTGSSTITISGTLSPYAIGQMQGSSVDSTVLTSSLIAAAVWDELLANHTDTGSAGNALATASSGGVDLNLLAQAVWEYATRTLTTSSGGATIEEIFTDPRMLTVAKFLGLK